MKIMNDTPKLNELCPCSSNIHFGDCCAKEKNLIPKGITIRHNAISNKKCDYMVGYLKKQPKEWATISTKTNHLGQMEYAKDPARVTQEIRRGKLEKTILTIVHQLYMEMVNVQAGETLQWFEMPVVLYYSIGGVYKTHADSENYDSAVGSWRKIFDRDYSILLYLSDDFTGGDVTFNMFNFSYHPKKGDMIFFPSDHRYQHTAEPVLSGNRYTIVSWCAIKESQKVEGKIPAKAIIIAD